MITSPLQSYPSMVNRNQGFCMLLLNFSTLSRSEPLESFKSVQTPQPPVATDGTLRISARCVCVSDASSECVLFDWRVPQCKTDHSNKSVASLELHVTRSYLTDKDSLQDLRMTQTMSQCLDSWRCMGWSPHICWVMVLFYIRDRQLLQFFSRLCPLSADL